MARVRLIHSKSGEAGPLLQSLIAAGHQVDYDPDLDSSGIRQMRQSPPEAFVIDLTRLPSHGREVAVFLRGQKATREIPIVFSGGAPEKVASIRDMLPDATY